MLLSSPAEGFCFFGNNFGCHTVAFALGEHLYLATKQLGYFEDSVGFGATYAVAIAFALLSY